MADFERIASLGDFQQGKVYDYVVGGKHVAVVRSGTRFYAMRNACTHAGFFFTPVDIEGETLPCLAHGAVFRLQDGEAIQGPADDPLELYDVRVEGTDVLVAPRDA